MQDATVSQRQMTLEDFASDKRRDSGDIPLLGKFICVQRLDGLSIKNYKNALVITLRTWLRWPWRMFSMYPQGIPGIGINQAILILADAWKKLIVIVDARTDEKYVVEPEFLLHYCKNWRMNVKGVQLVVCPKSYLYRYKGENPVEARTKCRNLTQNVS